MNELPLWMQKILEEVGPEHHDWLWETLARFSRPSEELGQLRAVLDRASRNLLDGGDLNPSIGYFTSDLASALGSAANMQRRTETE